MEKNKRPRPALDSSASDDSSPSSSSNKRSTPVVERQRDSDSDSPIAPKSGLQTPVKRALSLENSKIKRSKKQKKKQKSALRVWTEDDEISILKGMLGYREEKGAAPLTDYSAFHDFIKNSLHVEVGTRQVIDKIRGLKKKYQKSLVKKKNFVNFSPHEQSVFDLSCRIWGDKDKDKDGAHNQQKSNLKTTTVSKADPEAKEMSWQFVGKTSIAMGLDENIVKTGLELCSHDKKAELEEKWKQLFMDESNLFLRKLDLVSQESKMITEALKLKKGA